MKVKFKKLNEKAVIPKIASAEAACLDLTATKVLQYLPNRVEVSYGFCTEIQKGYKAVIVPRSSFTGKGWVMQNTPGQIDSDYRGEWKSVFEAIPGTPFNDKMFNYNKFPYEEGDRVAQCYLEKIVDFEFEEVKELETSERGTGGFGSTGTK